MSAQLVAVPLQVPALTPASSHVRDAEPEIEYPALQVTGPQIEPSWSEHAPRLLLAGIVSAGQ